jgi:tRNA pseudouridine38-40 synthase
VLGFSVGGIWLGLMKIVMNDMRTEVSGVRRIKLTVAYDGTGYCGWQIQPNGKTIEGVLDEAIERLTGEKVHVIGASRTDAGVSALGNVAVFDTDSTIPGERFAYALNTIMPEDVSIVGSCEVASDFHPRHCDTRKTYEYRIVSSKFTIPQLRNSTWNIRESLDVAKMREAAGYLIGEHDFKSFACVRTDAESTVRTIYSLEVESEELFGNRECQAGDGLDCTKQGDLADGLSDAKMYTIRVRGNGFLYNMVRIIAGTLAQVGKGQIPPERVKEMLEACDRTRSGQTAPPQGLTLVGIEYL